MESKFTKIESEAFHKIVNESNVVLEAGIVSSSLVFKLTVLSDSETVYIGKIRDLERYEKLKERYDTLNEVLEYVKDRNNIRLDLDRLSLTLIISFDNKVMEVGEIFLKKRSEELMGEDRLEEMMIRCNEGDILDGYEIRKGFELLARELLELKRSGDRGLLENMKEQILLELKEENKVMIENGSNCLNGVNKVCEENYGKLEESLLVKINDLDEEIRNLREELSEYLNERVREAEELKQQCLTNLQYIKTVESQTNQINFYLTEDEEKVEFYKNQKWCRFFAFDGKTLIKIKDDYNRYQFVFFDEVLYDEEYSFKVKIVKSDQKTIMIGVVDYEKQKEKQFSYNSNNAVCYNAKAGNKWPGAINEGNGVSVGETVEVRVDRKNSTIYWFVNNEQRARHESKMLGEKGRIFVPFVEMYEIGDIIEWSVTI